MNRSLQEKSSARLTAVQLLYQIAVTGDALAPAKMLKDYQEYLEANAHNPKEATLPEVPASIPYLKKLLEGVAAHAEPLEKMVDGALTGDWKKDRMSPLLLAILRLFAFELSHFEALRPAILINEYVGITSRFFGEAETGFINASLNAMANELRA